MKSWDTIWIGLKTAWETLHKLYHGLAVGSLAMWIFGLVADKNALFHVPLWIIQLTFWLLLVAGLIYVIGKKQAGTLRVRILDGTEWDASVNYHRIKVQNVTPERTEVFATITEIEPKPERGIQLPYPLQPTHHPGQNSAHLPGNHVQPIDLLHFNPNKTSGVELVGASSGRTMTRILQRHTEYTVTIDACGASGQSDIKSFRIRPRSDGLVDVVAIDS